jgi:restriction system protein
MIRAGDHNELIPVWREKGIASIGWPQLWNPKQYSVKDEMQKRADQIFSDEKPKSRNSWVNQVWRFSREIEKGDRVITYSKEKREYIVGTVIEPYFYNKTIGNPEYPNTVRVKWI